MSGRRNIMLGTAGHVDHGKTALVKLLTGCETDRLAEEKQRGLTIELGFAPCTMADERICGIVDVPGHVDFIRNMVAGAHGVDVVMLVVAADDGVMPQTREHLDILTLLGVRHGLVALTKIDLVGDEQMRALAVDDVRQAVRGTFLAEAPICPLSNITGEGFGEFYDTLNAVVDACQPARPMGLFRLWIERAFNVRGFGVVVSGIPAAGEVRAGDRLTLQPSGRTGRVRGMEAYGQASDVARAGECVALNLDDIDVAQLQRGRVLCEAGAFEPVRMFEAELSLLNHLPNVLKDNAEVHVHIGTGEAMAKVAQLAGGAMAPGTSAMVQVRLAEPMSVAPGERLVIRGAMAGAAGGRVTTLGGGRVLDASDTKLRRRRPWTLQALADRAAALDQPRQWLAVVASQQPGPISPADLARRSALPDGEARRWIESLVAKGELVPLADKRLVHARAVAEAREAVLDALRAFHEAQPDRAGLAPAELAGRPAAPAVGEVAIEQLLADGEIERRGEVLALAGAAARIDAGQAELCERIVAALAEAHLEPPLPADLATRLNVPAEQFEAMLALLAEQGRVVRLDAKVAMHPAAIAAASEVVLDLFRKQSGFSTVEFRDALGVSRKFAVPLLDYLDTQKLTVRSANRRTPGKAARAMLDRDRPGG